jgi:hypothetical protein
MSGAEVNNVAITAILGLHLAWILGMIFGALSTRGRRWLTAFHLASLIWGILVEVGPWTGPLTMAEDFFNVAPGLHRSAATV